MPICTAQYKDSFRKIEFFDIVCVHDVKQPYVVLEFEYDAGYRYITHVRVIELRGFNYKLSCFANQFTSKTIKELINMFDDYGMSDEPGSFIFSIDTIDFLCKYPVEETLSFFFSKLGGGL